MEDWALIRGWLLRACRRRGSRGGWGSLGRRGQGGELGFTAAVCAVAAADVVHGVRAAGAGVAGIAYNRRVTHFADRLGSLLESRLPVVVDSAGAEDDWAVVGPALLAASTRHLRAIVQVQCSLSSGLIGWQLVRSMYEYVVTYAWIAAKPEARSRLWLKADYEQRIKFEDDVANFEGPLLDENQRERIQAYIAHTSMSMPGLPDRATDVDSRWAHAFGEVEAHLPEQFRGFRKLYPLIYRNGSRFTHPTTHGVNALVSAQPRRLGVGTECPTKRDLGVIAAGILSLGLAVAVTATPAIRLTYDHIEGALSGGE